ncbi:hypothetical protein AQUCO_05600020v1 [Aquilegia coerulea]|uniref:Uncharacterized protein n=1 Tax=Aquilegia coerulea TaxID=218851 RepID=A0A2G5CG91_AQUCA|nr:hypothetical protein AQUCO_05600020v1 [Aquilegia coerulea]
MRHTYMTHTRLFSSCGCQFNNPCKFQYNIRSGYGSKTGVNCDRGRAIEFFFHFCESNYRRYIIYASFKQKNGLISLGTGNELNWRGCNLGSNHGGNVIPCSCAF